MRVTIKGQVTIPQEIRERYGFLPGTEVRFQDRDGVVCLVKERGEPTRGRALVEQMRGRAQVRLSTDEIMALTRGDD